MPNDPTGPRRTLRSDNNAGVCPEALDALRQANDGHALGYGDDDWSARAVDAFRALFGAESRIYFVATGTAANTLAVASLTEPWMRVLCYDQAHWNDDESTAPERITHCRAHPIEPRDPERSSKLTPDLVERHGVTTRGVHQPQPGVLTLSNPTEFGEVYTPDETRALADAAHRLGYSVHIDGARFANAVARHIERTGENDPGAAARALTIDSGVDALSFGGTKNGLALGEAVLFFPQVGGSRAARAAERFPFQRKSTGHLLSKHRFVSAPFAVTLETGAWLRTAAHANAMADNLSAGLAGAGVEIPFRVEANAVFPRLSEDQTRRLHERGHRWYPFGPADWNLARLMCSWDTQREDVDNFLADLAGAPD
ncbi:MAG: threonine aldolase family protein [Phycisphaerales bacterium]